MRRLNSLTHGREAPPARGFTRIARLLLVATPFLLALSTPATLEAQKDAERARAQAASCPNIALCCHASVRRGLLGPFIATLSGTDGGTPSFNWKVSAGQVAAGRGTSEILIDTKGLKGGTVLVMLEVGGYGPRCSATCLAEVPDSRGEPSAPRLATLSVSVKSALDGRPVPRARIKVYGADGAVGGQGETDARGGYERGGWAPGSYRVEVSAHRFERLSSNVTLDPYSSGSVALSLRPVVPPPTPTPTPTPSPTPTATPTPEPAAAVTTPTPQHRPVAQKPWWGGLNWLLLGVVAALATAGWLLLPRLSGAAGEAAAAPAEASPGAAAAAPKQADEVHCTAYAPPSAQPDNGFLVQVFAHLEGQAGELDALAACPDPTARRYDSKKLSGTIERGRELSLTLEMPGLEIDEPTQSITWNGEIECVSYGVNVPADFKPKTIVSKIVVAVVDAEGARVPVAHLKFMFRVTAADAPQPAAATPAQTAPPAAEQVYVPHRRAFISYASENRPEVAKRVQMLRAQGVECFWDVLTLNQGERWESSIYQFIDRSDIFYLFWSEAAKNSPWVVREIAYALCQKGGDNSIPPEIMPVPVEGPPVPPPPKYLEELHFNDPTLYFIKAEEAARTKPAPV
jgi:hypothetical protein